MGSRREKGMLSVPQFGGWDQKSTDYSMVFSRPRQNRKQYKTDFKRPTIDDENELPDHLKVKGPDSKQLHEVKRPQHSKQPNEDSVTRRKKGLTYLTCCIKA